MVFAATCRHTTSSMVATTQPAVWVLALVLVVLPLRLLPQEGLRKVNRDATQVA